MNDFLNNTSILPVEALTMSSREIAELTGKQHDNVLRDVRNMLESLGEGLALKFEGYYVAANGKKNPCFNLPKRECIILVSGYDVTMRARIIDRWMELEARAARPVLPDLKDPTVLLLLLNEQAKGHLEARQRAEAAEKQVAAAQPLLQAAARVEGTVGSLCFTDAAKSLKMNPQKFVQFLVGKKWIYKRVGNRHWVARQAVIDALFLEHSHYEYTKADGEEKISTQARVTGKGLIKIAEMLGREPEDPETDPEPDGPKPSPSDGGHKQTRRGMLMGVAGMVAAAAAAMLPAPRAKASVPAVVTSSTEALDRYIVFLAHEHRAALNERYPECHGRVPMYWFEDVPDIVSMVEAKPPSTRALVALAAFDPDRRRVRGMLGQAQA